MKKIIYIALSVAVLGLSSCEDQLSQQPVSSTTAESFYTNTNDFTQAVNGVYSKLTSYPSQVLWLGEMRSDNLNVLHDGNRDWQGINDFSPNITTTGFIASAWSDNFNGIFNANSVLQALETKGSIVTDATLRARFTAETRFLRAFYYFQLVRIFGKVPLVEKPLTAAEVESVPRSAVADIYKLIIADLEFASQNLPATYTGANIGRATANAAKGLLGLVYLTRSGPTYNIEGAGINSNEYDKALTLFNEVIASNQYQLLSTYPSVFAYDNENNKEVIFDVQFMSSSNGAGFPSHLAPVAFWTGQGISNSYGNGYGSSNFNVSKELKASYLTNAADVRNAFNIQLSYSQPFIKKYIDIAKKGTSGRDWPINFIVLRYADILLLKAEAILKGAKGTQTEVDALVNQVRNRAGLPSISNVSVDTLLEERRKEFLGEGIRWNDLVRSGNAVTKMNSWIKNDAITTINTVTSDFLIYPVPATEIGTKAGLYLQNPGYN